jgi:hypothetical protein
MKRALSMVTRLGFGHFPDAFDDEEMRGDDD